ncbi:hypothetical protein ACDY97_26885 [Rhizobium mongolense]|uniref:hypothetical protein n=1 Tax=Rhizobium mongolense TaxID=57676 RepID=UPI003555EC6B
MKLGIVGFVVFACATTAQSQNVAGLGAVLCREVLPAMDNNAFQSQLFSCATVHDRDQPDEPGKWARISRFHNDEDGRHPRRSPGVLRRNPDRPVVMFQAFPVRK